MRRSSATRSCHARLRGPPGRCLYRQHRHAGTGRPGPRPRSAGRDPGWRRHVGHRSNRSRRKLLGRHPGRSWNGGNRRRWYRDRRVEQGWRDAAPAHSSPSISPRSRRSSARSRPRWTPPGETSVAGFVAVGASQMSVTDTAATAYETGSLAATAEVFADATRWQKLVGCTPKADLSDACVTTYIKNFGRSRLPTRPHRRRSEQWLGVAKNAAMLAGTAAQGWRRRRPDCFNRRTSSIGSRPTRSTAATVA